MISAQFIFRPGTYDDEFHCLDAEIEAYVATIPGFLGAEKWVSFDGLSSSGNMDGLNSRKTWGKNGCYGINASIDS